MQGVGIQEPGLLQGQGDVVLLEQACLAGAVADLGCLQGPPRLADGRLLALRALQGLLDRQPLALDLDPDAPLDLFEAGARLVALRPGLVDLGRGLASREERIVQAQADDRAPGPLVGAGPGGIGLRVPLAVGVERQGGPAGSL